MAEVTFVKYCPACGEENPRMQPLCLKCGTDLMMVRAEMRHEQQQEAPASQTTPVAEATPADAPAAGGVERTMRIESASAASCEHCTLELVANPSVCFDIKPDQTVGRTATADIPLQEKVPDWQYISSRHAQFILRNGQWYVKHVGHTNYNIVDGTQFAGDEEAAIYDNSVLVIAKTPFRVRIGGH